MRRLGVAVFVIALGVVFLSSTVFAASVVEQWEESGHNVENLGEITESSPVMRDRCLVCHDGAGFEYGVSTRAELPESLVNTPNSIGCDTCHGDRGEGLMASGSTGVLANGFQVEGAGSGALCVSCHNGRKSPDLEKMPAPHGSSQADVLWATGGVRVPGESYPSSPHGANPESCVSCHMAEHEGVLNHTFRIVDSPEYVDAACGSCHPGLETVNRMSLADYDGDKVVEGIQDEVQGLLDLLHAAIVAKEEELGLHGGYSHGSFHFTDAQDNEVTPPAALYNAHFNLHLVEADASLGVHNPAYVVALLQKSYKELTGQDVPNAVLR